MGNPALRAEVLRLRGEGLTFGEIAERLGVTRNTVAGIVYRAGVAAGRRPSPATPAKVRTALRPSPVDVATGKAVRGFACMSAERRRELARKGGASVPAAKRAFALSRELAVAAGRLGGHRPRGGERA